MLLTKLHIPQTSDKVVHRQILFEKLNNGLNKKLILVSATAGYGKSTLLSDWINQNKIPACWLSLDARDNSPTDFITFIITSIQKKFENIGKKALELLKTPGAASIEYVLETFINDILSHNEEFVLVLDDFHIINNKHILDILGFLIEYKPKHFKLAISTRSDPALPFARLRSQNEILEIRSNDLSFSENDISELFNKKLRIGLTEKDINLLEQKTEGWIAGLQLTAITLQGRENLSEYIQQIAGDNRYIMDYLIEEALSIQNEEVRNFLLSTSVLEQLSGPLCDAILERNDSQSILESLEKQNLFIISLDNERKWFRYHHLFGDLLKQKLTQSNKERIPELHNNASLWFEKDNQPVFAIEHALKSGDSKRAMHLLNAIIEKLWENSLYKIIYKFGELFSDEDLITNPKVCIIYCWSLTAYGNVPKAKKYLEKIESNFKSSSKDVEDKNILGRLYLTFNFLSVFESNANAAFKYSELALKNLSPEDKGWMVWAYIASGEAHLLRFELDKCIQQYQKAIEIGRKLDNIFLILPATGKLAYVQKLKGQYQKSYDISKQLLSLFEPKNDLEIFKYDFLSAVVDSMLGQILIERNQIEEGLKKVTNGFNLSKKAASLTFKGYYTLVFAEINYKLGKHDIAIKLINDIEEILKKDVASWLNTLVFVLKNKIYIDSGKFQLVNLPNDYKLEKDGNNMFEYYFMNIAIARFHISQSKYNEALELLNELSSSFAKNEVYELYIETEILKAKVYQIKKKPDNAIESVLIALKYAQEERIEGVFLNEGELIFEILKEIKQKKSIKTSETLDSISDEYLNNLLKSFEKEKRTNKIVNEEVISSRELDTLRLIAEDLTNQEIANELYISITTVKTHVRNILLKLDAKNRSEAVFKAKEKGII